MFAFIVYVIGLFLLSIANAVVTYHILRYRDPDDASGVVLVVYYIVVALVLIVTLFAIDGRAIFSSNF
jgi:hypothetical protein